MTQKQFDKCIKSGIPIYRIWIKNTLHKEKIPYEQVRGCFSWINVDIPYSGNLKCNFMYASEDKLEKCIDKLCNYLEKEEKQKLIKATRKLECLKQIRTEREMNHEI